MKVYKFGGASVKNAEGIRNLASIVSEEKDNLVVVVSAFGKTTNALEKVLKSRINGEEKYSVLMDEVYKGHLLVVDKLFGTDSEIKGRINISFTRLKDYLITAEKKNFDFEYDQIVSYGEHRMD
jgi:aspartate kinase